MNLTMLVLDESDPQPPATRSQVVELLRSGALRRTVRWQPLLGTFGFVLVVLTSLGRRGHTGDEVVLVLRLSAFLLAFGAVFVFDDPAAPLISSVPMTWENRLWTRTAVAVAFITPMWCLVLAVTATQRGQALSGGILAGVTLELVCFLTLGLSVAGSLTRWADLIEPGIATAPAMVVAFLAVALPIENWQFVVDPGGSWAPAHERWLLLWVVALLALFLAARDPAAQRYRWLVNRPRPARRDES
jgi:hypothetical protein